MHAHAFTHVQALGQDVTSLPIKSVFSHAFYGRGCSVNEKCFLGRMGDLSVPGFVLCISPGALGEKCNVGF